MKLFALPDGTVNRLDRAQWLTCPFDLAFESAVIPTVDVELSLNVVRTISPALNVVRTAGHSLSVVRTVPLTLEVTS